MQLLRNAKNGARAHTITMKKAEAVVFSAQNLCIGFWNLQSQDALVSIWVSGAHKRKSGDSCMILRAIACRLPLF